MEWESQNERKEKCERPTKKKQKKIAHRNELLPFSCEKRLVNRFISFPLCVLHFVSFDSVLCLNWKSIHLCRSRCLLTISMERDLMTTTRRLLQRLVNVRKCNVLCQFFFSSTLFSWKTQKSVRIGIGQICVGKKLRPVYHTVKWFKSFAFHIYSFDVSILFSG